MKKTIVQLRQFSLFLVFDPSLCELGRDGRWRKGYTLNCLENAKKQKDHPAHNSHVLVGGLAEEAARVENDSVSS